jgi:hypothetical protein
VVQSPGTLRTLGRLLISLLWHKPIMGAYTGLWAGLSQDVTCKDGGKLGMPWGRWHTDPKKDILESLKMKEEGGTGIAVKFWDWCEEQTTEYAGAGN